MDIQYRGISRFDRISLLWAILRRAWGHQVVDLGHDSLRGIAHRSCLYVSHFDARLCPLTKLVSTTYAHLFLSHTGIGVAGSLVFAPASAVAGHWFLKKRSTAVGIVICGSGVSGIVYPIMFRRLFEEIGMTVPSPLDYDLG